MYDRCYLDYAQLITKPTALVSQVCSDFIRSVGFDMQGMAQGEADPPEGFQNLTCGFFCVPAFDECFG